MRLRESIRPPQRFDSELFYQPVPQRSLREAKNPGSSPSYIDYNPNLPPAAFPTLDKPRPAGETDQKSRSQREPRQVKPDGGEHAIHSKTRDKKADFGVDYEDIPIDKLENYAASNGRLNPVYVKNMAVMAGLGQNSTLTGDDMDDSDPEDVKARNGSVPRAAEGTFQSPDPEWCDLSPRLQVEIFDNVLRTHSWSSACHILGLTPEERVEIEAHFTHRNEQVEFENVQLKEMQEKQLRALLRIDNSTLRLNRVPHQLVFRKISRQCTRKLREGIQYDYLLCSAGEILNARRFLQRRGLDRRYAGEWSNNMAFLRTPKDDVESETFEWYEDTDPELPAVSPMEPSRAYALIFGSGARTIGNGDGQLQAKTPFINRVRRAGTVNPADLQVLNGGITSSPGWSEALNGQSTAFNPDPGPPHTGLVRLKIGTERAAQIRDYEELATMNPNDALPMPPPQHWGRYRRNLASPMTISPSLLRRRSSLRNSFHQPLERTIGGNWSYDFPEPKSAPPFTTSSMRFKQKLEEARLEAQREREENDACGGRLATDIDWRRRTACISMESRRKSTLPRSIPFFTTNQDSISTKEELPLPLSSPATRGGIEEYIDGSLATFPTSDLPSDLTAHESDSGPEDTPLTTPGHLSFSVTDQIQSMVSVRNCRQTPESEYADNGGFEDEMVLVPTENGNRVRF